MAHLVEKRCVYSFQKPMWHNIVEPSLVKQTATQVLHNDDFKGGNKIDLRPTTVFLNGAQEQVQNKWAIVRASTPLEPIEMVFEFCTDRYIPLQPADVCASFDANVNESVETMAFLRDGREMFISWVMPKCAVVTVKGEDEVELYGIIRCGFDTKIGATLFTATYRPVCSNTVNLAQSWANLNTDAENLRGNIWKGKAISKNLLRDFGYWMKHVHEKSVQSVANIESLFSRFAQVQIPSDAIAHQILYTAYPPQSDLSADYPAELRNDKKTDTLEFNQKQEFMRDGIYALFAGNGTSITPDLYGMMNATSEYFCHYEPSKRPIATSVMWGGRQAHIKRMVDVLKGWADK